MLFISFQIKSVSQNSWGNVSNSDFFNISNVQRLIFCSQPHLTALMFNIIPVILSSSSPWFAWNYATIHLLLFLNPCIFPCKINLIIWDIYTYSNKYNKICCWHCLSLIHVHNLPCKWSRTLEEFVWVNQKYWNNRMNCETVSNYYIFSLIWLSIRFP